MNGRLPKPLTPAQALALTITVVGELCQQRALCPPSRWHEDTSEDGPLVSDEMWAWFDSEDAPDEYAEAVANMPPDRRALYDAYMREKLTRKGR